MEENFMDKVGIIREQQGWNDVTFAQMCLDFIALTDKDGKFFEYLDIMQRNENEITEAG
jgi:hypothetical protein